MNQKIKNAWTKIEEGLGKCCLYKKAAHMLLNNQLRIVNSLYLTNEKCLHTLQYISLRTELILLPNLIRSLSRLICIRSPPKLEPTYDPFCVICSQVNLLNEIFLFELIHLSAPANCLRFILEKNLTC